MADLITLTILIPIVGAIAMYIGRPKSPRAVAVIFNGLSLFYALMVWQRYDAGGRFAVGRATPLDSVNRRRGPRRGRRTQLAARSADFSGFPVCFFGAKTGTRGLRAVAGDASGALRNIYRPEFCSLVSILRNEPGSRVLLIKIYGGDNRDYAAVKFFLYTFLGSVAMLLAFLGIYLAKGTFDFAQLADLGKTVCLPAIFVGSLSPEFFSGWQ